MQYSPRIAFGRWGENPELDAMRLRGLLNYFVETNVAILRANAHLPGLYEAGLTASVGYWFRPGDDDQEQFGDVLSVLEEGHGACGKMAPYRVAELRERHGIKSAHCTWEAHRVAGRDEIHILVGVDGRPPEDPSRALGMRG